MEPRCEEERLQSHLGEGLFAFPYGLGDGLTEKARGEEECFPLKVGAGLLTFDNGRGHHLAY